MTRLVLFLADRRGLTLVLGFAFYLATALFHDQVNETFLKYRDLVGSSLYRMTMMGATSLGLIGATWAVARRSVPGEHRRAAVTAWLSTLGLIALVYAFLVVLASEFVHLAQYAVLAVFLFALTRRYTGTIVWCTLLGALDEWYQYGVLHATWGVYYDFNDVVLNLLGGALGATFLFATAAPGLPSSFARPVSVRWVVESPAWRTLLFLLALGGVMLATGKLQLDPPGDGAWLLLSRTERPETFWNPVDWGGKPFHVLHPVSGVTLVMLLLVAYLRLDALAARLRTGRDPDRPATDS